jgi:DNA-binding NarL/FixJ family response regulator
MVNSEKPIRVLIFEDNRHIRASWEILIQSTSGIELVGIIPNFEGFLFNEKMDQADLFLIGLNQQDKSGIVCVKYMEQHYPFKTTMVSAVHEEDECLFEALCAGAHGFVTKTTTPAELILNITDIANQRSSMTPNIAYRIGALFHKPLFSEKDGPLSKTEEKILKYIALGNSYQTIADELATSANIVKNQIFRIYSKIHEANRTIPNSKNL